MATIESRISRLESVMSIGSHVACWTDKALWRAMLQGLDELREQKALSDDDREFLAACWQIVEFGGDDVGELERRLIEVEAQHA